MSKSIDLKAVRIKTHRTIVEDGLLEIMMGIYLVLSSFHISNRSVILNYLWLPIALVFIEIIRRRYIFPRTGYAKISLSAMEIIQILGAILIGTAVFAALVALMAASMGHSVDGNWQEIISYALILVLVISFCFIAYRFRIPRWYMHGISIGSGFLLSKMFDVHELVLGLGLWIILVGVVAFRRYLVENPLKSPDVTEVPNAR